MKKFPILAAAIVLALAVPAHGQEAFDPVKITQTDGGKNIVTSFRVALPISAGFSTLPQFVYPEDWWAAGDFMHTQTFRNYYLSVEPVSVRFSSAKSPFEVTLGLRYSFVDFCMSDSRYTFREGISTWGYVPKNIYSFDPEYDGTKSRFNAQYVGVPVQFAYCFGKERQGKVYVGLSAEYRVLGYTKYRYPRVYENCNDLFYPFRATVEAGVSFWSIGLWASWGLTPIFANGSGHTLSFGLVVGI